MAHRSRPTTNKRQREQARIAKRNDKAARLADRAKSGADRAGLPAAAALPAAADLPAPGADDGAARAAAADPTAWLVRLWTEIGALPPMARAVILFNLRDADGHGVVGLFPSAGVAGLRMLATALGMSTERLAEAWKSLPLDDPAIAARVGVTRPQIALLRRAARERLARRMAAR